MPNYDLAIMVRRLTRRRGEFLLPKIEAPRNREEALHRIVKRPVRFWSVARQDISAMMVDGVTPSVIDVTFDRLRRESGVMIDPLRGQLDDWAEDIGRWHTNRFKAIVQSTARVDIRALIEAEAIEPALRASVARSAALITSINTDTAARIERSVFNTFENGLGRQALSKALREDIGFSSKRARLVARDQLSTLSGSLDRARQTEAGIERYEWSTSRDDRVRRRHVEREGQRFAWNDPPNGGHPGAEIQCRCVAQAVIPGLE